ncbi:MAG: glycosyltransferase family 39 protein [Planctomycetota bacterium]|jgi:hypothetical protein
MKISEKICVFYNSKWLLWSLIGIGIFLRLNHFLRKGVLRVTEVPLAASLVSRSYRALLEPLAYRQIAPIGFLFIERFFIQIFGTSESSLRLFPLLAGIISIPLFLKLARITLDRKAIPIALTIFVASRHVIYYSSEVKQYSCDVAIALVLFLTGFYVMSRQLSCRRLLGLGLLGAVAVWFSHAAVFVLASIGMCLFVIHSAKKEWKELGYLSLVILLWIFSFTACYMYIHHNYEHYGRIVRYWKDAFMPFPPSNLADICWFPNTLESVFRNPGGFKTNILFVVICFFVGSISMLFKSKKKKVCILLFPLFFALGASGMHAYPFADRLLLFLTPSIFLMVAEGAEQMRGRVWVSAPSLGICVMLLVVFFPVFSAVKSISVPSAPLDVKLSFLEYLKNHRREGDVVYIHNAWGSGALFRYYASSYGLNENDYIVGENKWKDYSKSVKKDFSDYAVELDRLRGNDRVWVVFMSGVSNKVKFFYYYLDRIGTRIESFENKKYAPVCLYDLSKANDGGLVTPEGSGG